MDPADDPSDAALRAGLDLLSRRLRTRQELCALLGRKGFDERAVEGALEKLAGFGYLDEAKLAQARARALLSLGRLGSEGVARRLESQGIDAGAAGLAVAQASLELSHSPRDAARKLLERRSLLAPRTMKDRARARRLLSSRGYPEALVEELLGEPRLDPPDEGG